MSAKPGSESAAGRSSASTAAGKSATMPFRVAIRGSRGQRAKPKRHAGRAKPGILCRRPDMPESQNPDTSTISSEIGCVGVQYPSLTSDQS